jgi:hypothetical protein
VLGLISLGFVSAVTAALYCLFLLDGIKLFH